MSSNGTHSEPSVGLICRESWQQMQVFEALAVADIHSQVCASNAEDLATDAPDLDVAILYESGSGPGLLEAVRAARESLPARTTMIVVWPLSRANDSRRALRAGADGLVSDEELFRTLGPTINAVRAGLICLPRRMRAPLESESLSMREKQVLGMLVMGFTNAEIGAKLFLAESTVKSHLSSAYSKLGVRSRKDAATMILDPTEGLGPGILAITPA